MTDLAAMIGEVITVDLKVDGGDFVRVRVWLNVRKELTRFVSITPEGQSPVVMRVKYEKILCRVWLPWSCTRGMWIGSTPVGDGGLW
jgi:hypothetical protein